MMDFLSELQKGGVVMIPLLLGSVLGFAIVIERAFGLRHRKILVPEIVSAIKKIRNPEDVKVAERIQQFDDKRLFAPARPTWGPSPISSWRH